MPRKFSVSGTAKEFISEADLIVEYLEGICNTSLSDEHISWCYDYAIIRLYREFEGLVLWALVGSINNDTSTIAAESGFEFPKHLTDEVCFYLVTGTGYFDFKGRSGLISTLKKYLPDNHYLITTTKTNKFKDHIDMLCALRNYAAHESPQSKRAALAAVGQHRMGSAGSWLKRQDRFSRLAEKLKELAQKIGDEAPY